MQNEVPRMTALWKGCLARGPHSWVFTTKTEPLARFSPGNPFFSRAKSRYTLPVKMPAGVKGAVSQLFDDLEYYMDLLERHLMGFEFL